MFKNMFESIIDNDFDTSSKQHAKKAQALRKQNEHKAIENKVKQELLNKNLNSTNLDKNKYLKQKTTDTNTSIYLKLNALNKIKIWRKKGYKVSSIINDLIENCEL